GDTLRYADNQAEGRSSVRECPCWMSRFPSGVLCAQPSHRVKVGGGFNRIENSLKPVNVVQRSNRRQQLCVFRTEPKLQPQRDASEQALAFPFFSPHSLYAGDVLAHGSPPAS